MKKALKIGIVSFLSIFLLGGWSLTISNDVYAGACKNSTAIIPQWYDSLCGSDQTSIESPNDMSGPDSQHKLSAFVTVIALNIVNIILHLVGYVSIAFIVWGGFKYIIHGDDSSGVTAAKKTILNAVIGLVLSIAAAAIVSFIASSVIA